MQTISLTEKQRKVADFRFGLIADLVYSPAKGHELARLISAKAARNWVIPYSTRTTISSSCIRKWLTSYKTKGQDSLVPRVRSDTGRCKVLGEKEKELILGLLEQKPELCASVAVRVLQREGKLIQNISKSSLSRFIQASGFTRPERLAEKSKDQVLRYSFDQPLECVQVDAMHSFQIPDHTGKMKKAILIAFIDDATRRIVYSRICFTEQSLEFERGIYHVLQTYGRIRRLYTDNGSTFVSDQTKMILDSLGIPLIHSRPGRPKGRGKIERFFRTVRVQFEATLEPSSIKSVQDYDQRFRSWLESEYHRSGHSGLGGKTPLEAWLEGTKHILRLDLSINLKEVFRHQHTRSVSKDATVSLDGQSYEVPSSLIGQKVKLTTNPLDDVPQVRVFFADKDYGSARRVDESSNSQIRRILGPDTASQASLQGSAVIGGR